MSGLSDFIGNGSNTKQLYLLLVLSASLIPRTLLSLSNHVSKLSILLHPYIHLRFYFPLISLPNINNNLVSNGIGRWRVDSIGVFDSFILLISGIGREYLFRDIVSSLFVLGNDRPSSGYIFHLFIHSFIHSFILSAKSLDLLLLCLFLTISFFLFFFFLVL